MSDLHSEKMRVHLLRTAGAASGELEGLLDGYGYLVQWHDDGASLAEAAQKGNVETDCVLIDAMSAEGEGLLLLRVLRQTEDSPAVIFIDGLNGNAKRAARMLLCLIEPGYPKMKDRVRNHPSLFARSAEQTGHLERFDVLTSRERQIVGLVLQGMTSKKIARQLGISPRTVETHRVHIHAKLETKSLQELVWLAMDGGLAAPAE